MRITVSDHAESQVKACVYDEVVEKNMPIYEYECCKCCEKFERLIFRSDEAVSCPKCDSGDIQRVLSVFGFKSGGDKGAASSRMGSGGSSCASCHSSNCGSCH